MWEVVGWGRKSYLGLAEIVSFSSRDFSRRNKHDSFWLAVSTGYFYILFLWAIAFSDFLLLEISKHLVLPLSNTTFRANSHADDRFYKYLYLFQILYSMKSVFIKIHVTVFYIQVWLKCETFLLFFLIEAMVYRKKHFIGEINFFRSLKNKTKELHVLQTWGYNLDPRASFRGKKKAKRRPWNTSNTWLKFTQIEGIFFRIN